MLARFENGNYLEDSENNSNWCVERQGTDYDDIRYYTTEEDAKAAMIDEVNSEEYEDYELDIDDSYCTATGEEYYQKWMIYESPKYKTEIERIFNEIQLEINRTHTGIAQYAYELQDTWVATAHLDNVETLLNKLKELI